MFVHLPSSLLPPPQPHLSFGVELLKVEVAAKLSAALLVCCLQLPRPRILGKQKIPELLGVEENLQLNIELLCFFI